MPPEKFDIFNFIHVASDAPDTPGASFALRLVALDAPFAPPPELHVIAPFTLIFNVELLLNSHLSRLV